MAFAITQSCCSDASCVTVCPVNCIHPTPDEPEFGRVEMLYIDPRSCIDCGACADACPVDAVRPIDLLVGEAQVYADLNRDYYVGRDEQVSDGDWTARWDPPSFPAALIGPAARLRVAIVGSGPAASYTAAALLTTSAQVTMIERLSIPGGLIRFGVAPDHTETKAIGDRFASLLRNPRLELALGVEVGVEVGAAADGVTHQDLLAHHDAVVYAVGATADRSLGVAGEDLPGSLSARTFVGWYNGHPQIGADEVVLAAATTGRVAIVGNGNVALDAARILLSEPDRLAHTTIAPHALAELRRSTVREVVLVARRGPGEAAYSGSELRALLGRDDLEVVVDGGPELADAIRTAAPGSRAALLRDVPVQRVDFSQPATRRRLVLRFNSVVDRVLGDDQVDGVLLRSSVAAAPEAVPPVRLEVRLEVGLEVGLEVVPVGLLLRSVGYRSEPVPGLPFDWVTHTVPNEAGRVIDPESGARTPATYVVGWVKRGPSGGIGSNRADAAETVAAIVADANAGRIGAGRGSTRSFRKLLRHRSAVE